MRAIKKKNTKKLEQLFEEEMAAIMEQLRQEHLLAEELIERQVREEDFINEMKRQLGWLTGCISCKDTFLKIYYYNKKEVKP